MLHCHPIIYSLLGKLFTKMLATGYIPSDFGRGIIIPLLKSDSTRGIHKIESFRGITLSPITVSKIFEHCLMEKLCDYLYTDDRQFVFKPNTGCFHALYTVRHVVDYFVENDSTVNLCLIDVSKAFDKLNHAVLFLKLMVRGIPATFIALLKKWYDNVVACVRWNNVISGTFEVTAGVRQGDILSPCLTPLKLKRSSCCKYLGMFIDEKLKWTEHIKFVYSSILKYVGIFYKIRQKMPPYCLKNLYYSTVYPKLLYGIELYANTCKSYLNDLMILNNKVLRVLQCKQLDTNTIELYTNFKSLPINLLFLHQALLFTFKFVHCRDGLPCIFKQFLNVNASVHNYYTRTRNDFHINLYSTSFGGRCFSLLCSKLWNSIPSELRCITSIALFKSNVTIHLLDSVTSDM